MNELLAALRHIVGDAHVLSEGDLSAWEQDWRQRVRGKALAVVRPANTQQVADVVKASSEDLGWLFPGKSAQDVAVRWARRRSSILGSRAGIICTLQYPLFPFHPTFLLPEHGMGV